MILAPFWEVLEAQAPPKIHPKSSKTLQKSILRRVLDTSVFEGGFWKVFGRVLDGFWEDFGRVLGGFLRRFWEDGHAKNDIWADKFYVPELLVYSIRL